MDMAAQVWTLIGVIIAGGTAAFVAILSGTRALGARVDSLGTELRGEISGLRAELKDEIGGLRAELKDEIGGLRAELKDEIGGLRADIGRLDLRIDGLSHDLGTVNRTLGELVAKSHVHEHAA
jgi:hypothetical protein